MGSGGHEDVRLAIMATAVMNIDPHVIDELFHHEVMLAVGAFTCVIVHFGLAYRRLQVAGTDSTQTVFTIAAVEAITATCESIASRLFLFVMAHQPPKRRSQQWYLNFRTIKYMKSVLYYRQSRRTRCHTQRYTTCCAACVAVSANTDTRQYPSLLEWRPSVLQES